MTQLSYRHIKGKVKELANRIEVPANLLPTYRFSNGDESPLIEIDKIGNLHYVKIERGKEWSRKTTDELDELLYRIFFDVTFEMAFRFELNNRIENQDCRRIAFDQHEKLLGILSESWRQKGHNEHLQILVNHPFDDLAGLRATYCRELREKGLEESEIDKLAYEKYPTN
jgi:hypothetical protein